MAKGSSRSNSTRGADYGEALEAAKMASVGQLLLRTARLFNERAMARVHERRGVAMKASHTALFPHIALQGTRVTELAEKLGITKQAVGQLVGELEQVGMLRREPDPSDGRAKLVRFTARGRRALLDGIGLMRTVEQDLTDELGQATLARLKRDLTALMDVLESRAASMR